MRFPSVVTLCALLACCTALADDTATQTWAYRIGATHPPRQGNFCDDQATALEIAAIFERFGPRTGFSALAGARECSTRVHEVTPEALLKQVHIPLEGGGEYVLSFIQVGASDGTRPVLVTTRRLIKD